MDRQHRVSLNSESSSAESERGRAWNSSNSVHAANRADGPQCNVLNAPVKSLTNPIKELHQV